ncbi:hypothetical protein HK104_006045 [Borealophlyctis nickersoniae]|nr:hypothetical protein HK104_006045 [Borealophlyctis nickersoniae]
MTTKRPLDAVTDLPRRPGVGKTGRHIKVMVNVYPLRELVETIAYQYDVSITPAVPVPLSRVVWKLAEEQFRAGSKKAYVVYDGRNNAFTTMDLGDSLVATVNHDAGDDAVSDDSAGSGDEEEVTSDGDDAEGKAGKRMGGWRWDTDDYGTITLATAETAGGAKFSSFKVVLRKTATIDFHELLLYAAGKGPESDAVQHAVTALSTVLRHAPSMTYTSVGANFYTPHDSTPLTGGLEVWRGYHQSLRVLMAGHLGVNVDVAATVFRKGDYHVLDLAMDIFNVSDVVALARAPQFRERLLMELKGAKVVTTHRGDKDKQRFRVGRLSPEGADKYMFMDADGATKTVAQYFAEQYNYKLKFPFLPCALKPNGKTAFPLEVLKIVPGQRFMRKLNGQQTSEMIRQTVQKPEQRASKIQRAVDHVLLYENEYMKSFGLNVETSMLSVPARVLPAPMVVFAPDGQNRPRAVPGTDGFWQLRNQRLAQAVPLVSYAFIFFIRISEVEACAVRDTLVQKFLVAGLNIQGGNAPVLIGNPFQAGNIRAYLQTAYKEAKMAFNKPPQLLICVIDKDPKGIYEDIKRITLTEAGVLSQCLLSKHVGKAQFIKDQYALNVALKINIKLGGATNYVDRLPYFEVPTMVVGADVTHAHAGSAAPSVAAVVTSLDSKAVRYQTFLRAQPSRVEIINDLENIIGTAVDNFHKTNKDQWPERLLFFRDGVSSGQFKEVRETELAAVKAALAARGIETAVTFIVVQKRHHLRFFPTDLNYDKSGNCLPGTAVDTDITHPTEFNFILQSHAGLQGTSRPTLYHVLHDEIQMGADQLQQLCFNLCFLAERATRSISMVAPAYRAHLAAYYGRMFLEGDFTNDTASTTGTSQEIPVRINNVKDHIAEKTMYYM